MYKVIDNTWSGRIIIDGEVVKKVFKEKAFSRGCLGREIGWLVTMDKFDRVPSLIRIGPNYMEMQYMGEPITKETIPKNWEDQMKYILDGLKKYKCSHNDIKPEDILVKDEIINLVDFGWATKIGETIPKNWPLGIGREYKVGVHVFDDKHAFAKSMEIILRGGA